MRGGKLTSWVWALQICIVAGISVFYFVSQLSKANPQLNSYKFLETSRKLSGPYDNLKFKIRGPRKPQSKIIIVAIDEDSLSALGRWPWSRSKIAAILYQLTREDLKAIGLDIIFAEEERLVPEKIEKIMTDKKLSSELEEFESDRLLGEVLFKMKSRIVLGWAADGFCEQSAVACPQPPANLESLKKFEEKQNLSSFEIDRHLIPRIRFFVSNHPKFNQVSKFAGLLNAQEDGDGVIRRVPAYFSINNTIFPSLAVSMAKAGMQKDTAFNLPKLPQDGEITLNPGGGAISFPYVSAVDVLNDSEMIRIETAAGEEMVPRHELFRDAYVLIGTTSQGLRDIKNFSFDIGVPGVEGHAWALENILSGTNLRTEDKYAAFTIFLFMLLIGVSIAWALSKLSALKSIGVCATSMAILFAVDQWILFASGRNYNFFFLYVEIGITAILGIGARFLLEEKQKRHIHSIFGHYVSPKVVQNLVKSEEPLSLFGDKKVLTIFFSDIRGFTKMSERLDPRNLSEMLNHYMTLMTEILGQKYEGTLDKYIGDAIMAFWGAPIEQEDHATKACLSAVEMQRALAREKGYFKQKYDVDLSTGMGLHTGEVIVGNMGSEKNMNYTAIGDAVNLASRIEGLSKHYGCDIIISKSTYEKISTKDFPAQIRHLDRVRVVGKGESTDIYQIFPHEVSQKAINLFHIALRNYWDRHWEEALKLFQETALLFEADGIKDKTCLIYQERASQHIMQAPPDWWDGSHDMRTK
jgi:adenylate cyclase